MEKLEELRVMSYNDLEKKAILSVQEIFYAQLPSFNFDRFAYELVFFAVGALHG